MENPYENIGALEAQLQGRQDGTGHPLQGRQDGTGRANGGANGAVAGAGPAGSGGSAGLDAKLGRLSLAGGPPGTTADEIAAAATKSKKQRETSPQYNENKVATSYRETTNISFFCFIFNCNRESMNL